MANVLKMYSQDYYYSGTHKYIIIRNEDDGDFYLEMVEGPDPEIMDEFIPDFDPNDDLGYDSESDYTSESESEIDDLDDELIDTAPEYDSGLESDI